MRNSQPRDSQDPETEPNFALPIKLASAAKKEIALYSGGGYGGYGPDWPYGRDYGDIYSRSAMSTATSSTIPPGHLVLDIYDSSHRDLVWRGNVSGVLSPGNKGNNLQKAVARLLKYFPPKAKN